MVEIYRVLHFVFLIMKKFEASIPYENSFLLPNLSVETVDFHFGKHHTGYANTLNGLIADTDFEANSLEEIIISSRGTNQKVFNNAAQLYNHDFYWKCLTSKKTSPSEKFLGLIEKDYGNFENFLERYIAEATTMFGSGWCWMLLENEHLTFQNTSNAENFIGTNKKAICVIDLWEHAYYIDFRNDRTRYIETLVKNNINWSFCSENL